MRKPLSLFLTLTILCAALTGCTFHSGSTSAASTSAATPDGPTLRLRRLRSRRRDLPGGVPAHALPGP